MRIVNVFDAVRDGTFENFIYHYDGRMNQVSEALDINLLCMALTNDERSEEKLKIIAYLLKEGVDVNYVTRKSKKMLYIYFIHAYIVLQLNMK